MADSRRACELYWARNGSSESAAGLHRNRAHPAASLPVSSRRSRHGARTRQANRGDKECVPQRALSVTSARRATRSSADDSDGVHRAGGRDPDSVQSRKPRSNPSLQRYRARSLQTAGLCRRRCGDRSQGQEPAQPRRPASRLRACERSCGCRWNDDIRARTDGSLDARRDAPLDERRRLLFDLHVVSPALFRSIERSICSRNGSKWILVCRVHYRNTKTRGDLHLFVVPGDRV